MPAKSTFKNVIKIKYWLTSGSQWSSLLLLLRPAPQPARVGGMDRLVGWHKEQQMRGLHLGPPFPNQCWGQAPLEHLQEIAAEFAIYATTNPQKLFSFATIEVHPISFYMQYKEGPYFLSLKTGCTEMG